MKCDSCDAPAICKLTLTDLEDVVIDTFHICENCNVVSVTIRDGKPLSITEQV